MRSASRTGWLAQASSCSAVLREENIGVGPVDRAHERLDVVAGLGAVIHLIRVLIHVECENWLTAGEGRRVIGGPGINEALVARIPVQQYPAGAAALGLAHRDKFGSPPVDATEIAGQRLSQRV